jgi:hypothetical protein
MADARRCLDIAGARMQTVDGLEYWTIGGSRARKRPRPLVHLLPIYDEYLIAYRDLRAVPRSSGGRGRIQQAVVAGGQVAGTWKPVRKAGAIALEIIADRRLSAAERRALNEAASRYGRFHGVPVSIAAS